jgi:hypothetical protein
VLPLSGRWSLREEAPNAGEIRGGKARKGYNLVVRSRSEISVVARLDLLCQVGLD